MHVLGVDVGFGYTKATDGRAGQAFKSLVGEAVVVQYTETILPSGPKSPPRHFEIGEEKVFVGELAEQQSRGRGFTLDPGMFFDRYALTLALAAIAPYVKHGEPVRVVSGLPISFFRRYRDRLITLLQGRHPVNAVHSGSEIEEKQVYIERVRVIPQPFGSLFGLMLNDEGKIVTQRFVTEKIGLIDIGFRTTDYAVADRTRYSERGSGSSDAGMSMAYSAISRWLQEKSGVNVEVYRLYEAASRGTIKIKGVRYDLKGLVERAYTQLATRIAGEAARLWSDDWDIDAIILTGGGGATLAPYLQALVEGEVLPQPAGEDARLNNVKGYWKYGRHIWPTSTAADGQD